MYVLFISFNFFFHIFHFIFNFIFNFNLYNHIHSYYKLERILFVNRELLYRVVHKLRDAIFECRIFVNAIIYNFSYCSPVAIKNGTRRVRGLSYFAD